MYYKIKVCIISKLFELKFIIESIIIEVSETKSVKCHISYKYNLIIDYNPSN